MDSLFDSMNIHDLLSARDLTDPTTPLSAPDLRLLITKLESHSLQIKSKVQTYLTLHHSDFSHLFSLCNDAVSHSTSLSGTFSNLLESLDHPVDVEITELVKRIEETMREARVNRELLGVVRVIVGFKERLDRVKECLRVRELGFCAEEVRDLKGALRVGEEEEGEPDVYRGLRDEWSDRFDEV